MQHILDDHEDQLNLYGNNQKLCNEKGEPRFEFEWKSLETETAISSEFSNRRKAAKEPVQGSEDKNKSKRVGL